MRKRDIEQNYLFFVFHLSFIELANEFFSLGPRRKNE